MCMFIEKFPLRWLILKRKQKKYCYLQAKYVYWISDSILSTLLLLYKNICMREKEIDLPSS